MITDPIQRSRRQRLAILILVALSASTAAGVGLMQHSLAAGLLTVAMAALVFALLVVGFPDGAEWPRQRSLGRWERLSLVWLMAAAAGAGVLFLVVGVAMHHGSWAIGLTGFTAALAAGVIAVRAFLRP